MSNSITVGELKEMLECYDDETEVRIMHQPNYPFEYSIANRVFDVVETYGQPSTRPEPPKSSEPNYDERYKQYQEDLEEWQFLNDERFQPTDEPESGVVYLVEGRQLGYGTKDAWN